jgi:hypothetical protein
MPRRTGPVNSRRLSAEDLLLSMNSRRRCSTERATTAKKLQEHSLSTSRTFISEAYSEDSDDSVRDLLEALGGKTKGRVEGQY